MMTPEMMKQMPHMMGQGMSMMNHPATKGAMMVGSGLAAGHALFGPPAILRNPLLLLAGGLAAGIAAGYLLHKHEKEVVAALSKLTGIGKDFALQQRENLDDLIAEAQENEAAATPVAPAASPAT
jgi:hypothetical protein